MGEYRHEPHPWSALRKELHKADAQGAQTLNDRIGALITRTVSTMKAVYIAIAVQIVWIILGTIGVIHDGYPFPFLLFVSNLVQLILMLIVLVGQSVLSKTSDKRAEDTYQDAESLLHEAEQVQAHLKVQDQDLKQLITHAESMVSHLETITAAK